jgi:carbamoyl-phosphate synthase large subunit
MEHLERAGVHSGDSISIYPPQNICDRIKAEIMDVTKKIALALEVIGMVNIQFIEFKDELYIIEVNPRSSRTVPYISKVTGVPIIDVATKVMLGEKLTDLGYYTGIYPEAKHIAVKVPVFSTEKLPQVEVSLGPEMRSTGEVLGVGKTLINALFKGFTAAKSEFPKKGGTILVTIKQYDQPEFVPLAKRLQAMGYKFMATEGTARLLQEQGIPGTTVKKISEGVPNILDAIRSGMIDLVINTPTKTNDVTRDGFLIRRCAAECSVNLLTSLDTFKAFVEVMESNITVDDVVVIALGDNL